VDCDEDDNEEEVVKPEPNKLLILKIIPEKSLILI
jgi:hypothetical protein